MRNERVGTALHRTQLKVARTGLNVSGPPRAVCVRNDVIVGDNPSHGTVQTSSGRVFFVGVAGMRNRTAAWQVFPAAIHFRCDKNGSCALTRANSPVSMQARLAK